MGNIRNWESRWQDDLKLSGTGHDQQGCFPTEPGRERARLGAGAPFAPTLAVEGDGHKQSYQ